MRSNAATSAYEGYDVDYNDINSLRAFAMSVQHSYPAYDEEQPEKEPYDNPQDKEWEENYPS